MSTAIVVAIIAAVSSSGVMSLVIFLLQRHDRKKEAERENESVQTKMLLGLGHDKVLYLTDKYVKRGSITLKEKRNLEFLVAPYFDLGGNGDCRIGYDACQKLPVVSDEVADEIDIQRLRKEFGFEAE